MPAVIGTDLHEAARLLKAGELVAIPTETVYGLAANALDEAAVLKVFEAKQRPAFDPLIVHVHGLEQVREVVRELPPEAEALMRRFWPGPLTLVLPARPGLHPAITGGSGTVGVRVTSGVVASALAVAAGGALVSTSATPSGQPPPTTATGLPRLPDKSDEK